MEERKPNVDQPAFGQTEFRNPIDQFSCVVRGGEKKRTIERDMKVPLIFSKFFVELHYRTVIVSGKCESISFFVQWASRWER